LVQRDAERGIREADAEGFVEHWKIRIVANRTKRLSSSDSLRRYMENKSPS
jgi:hypothetical protein